MAVDTVAVPSQAAVDDDSPKGSMEGDGNDGKGDGGGGMRMIEGHVHFAASVYLQQKVRAVGGTTDSWYRLFTPEGVEYPFRDCDKTGKLAKGEHVLVLRSKVAVQRYLERDGATEEELEKMEAALAAAKVMAAAEVQVKPH
jgi:hypothetical protein